MISTFLVATILVLIVKRAIGSPVLLMVVGFSPRFPTLSVMPRNLFAIVELEERLHNNELEVDK